MTTITLVGGTIVYFNDVPGVIQTYVNAANVKGAAVLKCYSDNAFTQPVYVNMRQVLSFK